MRLTDYEKETVILFNEEEPTAEISTYNKKLISRLIKFNADYPELCTIDYHHFKPECLGVTVAKDRLKINIRNPISEEASQSISKRMKELHSKT